MAQIKSYPNNVNEEIGAEHVMRWHHGRTSGVYGATGELAVAALLSPGMAVTVSDGEGWLSDGNYNGIHFWNDLYATTSAKLQLSVDTADGVLNRIDRVIVEWSMPNYTQLPEIKILKGTAALTPSAPALTNNTSTRQISLAKIAVAAGTLSITSGMITDERADATVCGVVTETTNVDTSVAQAQFAETLENAQNLVEQLQGNAVIDHASTHAIGGDDELPPAAIGAEPVTLRFTDQSVSTSGWATYAAAAGEETDIQNDGYTYRKSLALTGVLATMHAVMIAGKNKKSCGASINENGITYDGGIKLYAKSVPTAAFTLRWVACFKGLS